MKLDPPTCGLELIHPLSSENDLYADHHITGMEMPPWYRFDHIYPAQMSIVWPQNGLPYPQEAADDGTKELSDIRGSGPLVSVEEYRQACSFVELLRLMCLT